MGKGEIKIMDKKEYYKRIERINNRFKTDRVSADEEYHLVCQRNYLSTKYIENLEQQCKKQKEVIDRAIEYIKEAKLGEFPNGVIYWLKDDEVGKEILQILEDKEVSE